ncbi:DUF3440 domain-containing protein [Shewanella sp. MBTL60-007]|uniref:DUF3440 domain-containing protein n=1 Tax=Shewanella sp. MBTL60-007 TaxID=2815911 RepID=UPI001BC46FB0|nr:DUF3440 domain-containing protein [Shewanella sp. MBTL60-007]GIU32441.1 phosphoadenosine phosphosulfate reductase [Shewanella sp. MBTL60-007]
MKKPIGLNVFEAATQRMNVILDEFEHLFVSFSGGKDSAALLNLAIQVAKARNQLPIDVLIIDMEAQYQHTIELIDQMVDRKEVNAYWICLPLSLRNAISQFQPKWICWDPTEKDKWLRPLPQHRSVISDVNYFKFYHFGMEFEDFVDEFSLWYQAKHGGKTACLIGIRADESLNRYKTIKNRNKEKYKEYFWTTKVTSEVYKAYPIYDWKTEDVWAANGKNHWNYNHIYDLMHKAGVPLSLQRLCQPFGDDQRKGLWLYQILEPNTWEKLVQRVNGCNFGARYSKDQGRILGYYRFELPAGHSYKSYSKFLLKSMPPHMATHYRERIFKFLLWWKNNGKSQGVWRINDFEDKKLEAKLKVPSWRRICKVLIKNDYWCRGLSFAPSKKISQRHLESYNKYL